MSKQPTSKMGMLLSDEQKKRLVEEIISYFLTERDEEIGVIAAEELVDYVANLVGVEIYNKGVDDTLKMVRSRLTDVTVETEVMLKKDI